MIQDTIKQRIKETEETYGKIAIGGNSSCCTLDASNETLLSICHIYYFLYTIESYIEYVIENIRCSLQN